MPIGEIGAPKQMMPPMTTPEKTQEEKEALFDSWLYVSANGKKKIDFGKAPHPIELSQAVEMYEEYAPYGRNDAGDAEKAAREAEKFRELSGGYDIEDFLARKNGKENRI